MIEFKDIKKVYKGGKVAVDEFNLTVEEGEFICFIGTSGSGKTTTMRMINRMIEPTSGTISINGQDIMAQDAVTLRREIGYVIQNIGLLPHMTIRDNITMVPKLLKWDNNRREEIAERMIKLAELPADFLDRYPAELSGGQQQRVGVVRALAADQDIILMDEPFGALDPITRDSLQDLVKELQEELGKTIVFVTHDMDEALKLATRIVIMSHGKIVQVGTPDEILRNPANDFVANFIGQERLIQAKNEATMISEVMRRHPVTTTPGKSLANALELMRDKKVDSLLVTDDAGHLKGIVDIQDIQANFKKKTSVSDIMEADIYSVKETSLVSDSVERILKRGYRIVPVVNAEAKLVGIVTRATLVDIVYDAIWGDTPSDEMASPHPVIESEQQPSEGTTPEGVMPL